MNNQSLIKHTTRQHPNGDASSDPSLRPFACEYENCESTFRFREHLKAHQRTVHNGKLTSINRKSDFIEFIFSQENRDQLRLVQLRIRQAEELQSAHEASARDQQAWKEECKSVRARVDPINRIKNLK